MAHRMSKLMIIVGAIMAKYEPNVRLELGP